MTRNYLNFFMNFRTKYGLLGTVWRASQVWKWKTKVNQERFYRPAPFLVFLENGQQTNSTPEKTSIPQGKSMAKLLTFMPRSWQAVEAVLFHWSKSQHLVWLWMWSNRQCSGTSRASLWKAPAVGPKNKVKEEPKPFA